MPYEKKIPASRISLFIQEEYSNDTKYSDRQTKASSVDPDQTPRHAASDQGLHCLPLV